jgi:hypothetical protein
MNYCIYNKELDRFLCLFNTNKQGFVKHNIKWDDEYNYVLADITGIDEASHTSTAWSMDESDGRHGYLYVLIYRIIYGEHTKKRHMKDIRFVPIMDGIPDFENECAL